MKLFRGKIDYSLWKVEQLAKIKGRGIKPKTLGYRLELYRIWLGLKTKDMADHISVSQGSYSDIRNNKSKPSCGTLGNIMVLNECDPVWLVTGT